MATITNDVELKEAIRQLESDKVVQGYVLKEACVKAFFQINPISRLEEQINLASPFSLSGNAIGTKLIGWLSGYLIKKWITGKTGNPIRKVLGSAVQLGVAQLIALPAGSLAFLGRYLIHLVFSKPQKDNGTD